MNTNKHNLVSYLSFRIGQMEYAVPVQKVIKILEADQIIQKANVPKNVIGIINISESVVPVIDLGQKFEKKAIDVTEEASVIVIEVFDKEEKIIFGALVDEVITVVEVCDSDIHDTSSLSNSERFDFLNGIADINKIMILLINLSKLFSSNEVEKIKGKYFKDFNAA